MKNHFMAPSFSIKIPCWKILHFKSGKKVGESRPAWFKGLAHYDCNGKALGKSMRNLIGELIHYDTHGNMIGYCKHKKANMLIHYDMAGNEIAHTLRISGLVYFHRHKMIQIFH